MSESDDAQIVYTLDGSEPTSSSKKVSNGTAIPFTEEGDYILKAGLLLSSGEVKGIITRSYTLKEDKPLEFVIPSFCTMGSDEVCAFFEAPMTWTNTVACWAWTDTPSDNFTYSQRSGWPGVDCVMIGTADNGNAVWKWTWDGTKEKNSSATQPAKIIFSNAGSPQTADLVFQNGGYYDKDGLKAVVTALDNTPKVDFNEDGDMNVTDVVTLINCISKDDFTGINKEDADVNGDGEVNVTDVVTLILMIATAK